MAVFRKLPDILHRAVVKSMNYSISAGGLYRPEGSRIFGLSKNVYGVGNGLEGIGQAKHNLPAEPAGGPGLMLRWVFKGLVRACFAVMAVLILEMPGNEGGRLTNTD